MSDIPGGSKKSGPKGSSSGGHARKSALRSPTPKPGSDSDVRLVGGGGVEFLGSDADVKLVGQDSSVQLPEIGTKTPKVGRQSGLGGVSPSPKKSSRLGAPQPDHAPPNRPSRLGGAAQPADSGVRLVPMDSDSDVKIVGAGSDEVALGASPPPSATDSDIRLERYAQPTPGSGEGAMMLTEEINLDEEIKKQEAALQQPQSRVKPKSKIHFPTTSPFELSESDVDSPSSTGSQSGSSLGSEEPNDSSDFDLVPAPSAKESDFDLSPADSGSGSVLLEPDQGDDFSLELPDDGAAAPEMSALSGPSSGISLQNPVDAGISLEEGSPDASDMDFDLSLEVEATPKPVPTSSLDGDNSDSGFELSLDADDSGHQAAPTEAGADSEFELSLDADDSGQQAAASPGDSDSEFELTLDDSGNLSADDSSVAQVKGDSEEKDIFETDFEVPALEDESGSQVAALDTDLDSSDFDIALDDSAVEEDESQSQVVALDEEADEAATTRATDGEEVALDDGEEAAGFGDLEVAGDEEEAVAEVEEELDDAKVVVKEKLLQPAPSALCPSSSCSRV